MFGKDAIDFRASVSNFAGKNHAVRAGSQTLIPRQLSFQGFDVALFPFEPTQCKAELFSRLGGQLPKKVNNLRGKVDLCHGSRAERGEKFVRPFS